MKKKNTLSLGDAEMEVLQLVWDLGEASVSQVQDALLKSRKVAYTTVMTTMQNLTRKGFLKFRKDGASYIYRAAQEPKTVRKNMLNHLMTKVFKGSPAALIQTLAENEELSEEERIAIRNLIDTME